MKAEAIERTDVSDLHGSRGGDDVDSSDPTTPEESSIPVALCVHSSHDHGVKEFLEVLAFAEEEKVGMEFRLAPDIITHLYNNRETVDRLGRMRMKGHPIQAHSHFAPGIGMDGRRALLRRTLQMAGAMGLRMLTMHPSPYLEHLERYAYFMAPMIREFGRHRVIMAIENVPAYDAHSMNRLFYQFRKRLDRFEQLFLGMCIDIGHAHCLNRDPVAFMNTLSAEIPIMNAHVHDNFGDRDAHLEIGRGDIDFVTAFQVLFERYTGSLVLEYWENDHVSMKTALGVLRERCRIAFHPSAKKRDKGDEVPREDTGGGVEV